MRSNGYQERHSCKNINGSCFNFIAKLDESFIIKVYCVFH